MSYNIDVSHACLCPTYDNNNNQINQKKCQAQKNKYSQLAQNDLKRR